MNGFAIEVEEIEQEQRERIAVPLSDAFWIRLNEVVPSGRTAQLAVEIGLSYRQRFDRAAAIAGYLRVQSSPVRVRSWTAPRSSRACIR